MENESLRKKINDIIEDIQEANVKAGGRFMRQKEVKEMSVHDLLKLLVPNDVEFEIIHKD